MLLLQLQLSFSLVLFGFCEPLFGNRRRTVLEQFGLLLGIISCFSLLLLVFISSDPNLGIFIQIIQFLRIRQAVLNLFPRFFLCHFNLCRLDNELLVIVKDRVVRGARVRGDDGGDRGGGCFSVDCAGAFDGDGADGVEVFVAFGWVGFYEIKGGWKGEKLVTCLGPKPSRNAHQGQPKGLQSLSCDALVPVRLSCVRFWPPSFPP